MAGAALPATKRWLRSPPLASRLTAGRFTKSVTGLPTRSEALRDSEKPLRNLGVLCVQSVFVDRAGAYRRLSGNVIVNST